MNMDGPVTANGSNTCTPNHISDDRDHREMPTSQFSREVMSSHPNGNCCMHRIHRRSHFSQRGSCDEEPRLSKYTSSRNTILHTESDRMDTSASDLSGINSGAEYDSGAQDLYCDDPQSLHLLLRCEYPDLYQLVFPDENVQPPHHAHHSIPTTLPDTPTIGVLGTAQVVITTIGNKPNRQTSSDSPVRLVCSAASASATAETDFNRAQSVIAPPTSMSTRTRQIEAMEKRESLKMTPTSGVVDGGGGGGGNSSLGAEAVIRSDSVTCPDWVQRLVDCADQLHTARLARYRTEVRRLTNRLQAIQARRLVSQQENQHLRAARDRMEHELRNRTSQYEKRLAELSTVISELQERLKLANSHCRISSDGLDEFGISANHQLSESVVNEVYLNQARLALSIPSEPSGTPGPGDETGFVGDDAASNGSTDGDTSIGAIDGDNMALSGGLTDVMDPYTAPTFDLSRVGQTRLIELTRHGLSHTGTTAMMNSHMFQEGTEDLSSKRPGKSFPSMEPNIYSVIDYQSILASLQAQLACVTGERDSLSNQLRMHQAGQTVSTTQATSQPELSHQLDGRSSLQTEQGQCLHSQDTPLFVANHQPTFTKAKDVTRPNSGLVVSHGRQSTPNGYSTSPQVSLPPTRLSSKEKLPTETYQEPDWVIHCVEQNERLTSTRPAQNNAKAPSDQWIEAVDQLWIELGQTNVTSTHRGNPHPMTPNALSQFLLNLSHKAPHPHLADLAHQGYLTCSRVLAVLGRLHTDCLVSQINLTEAKSTADRMQCQLNQVEGNWGASLRAATLADACLELSECMNQLYATELAIVLYRQQRKSSLSGRRFSALSSSTSSSSSPPRNRNGKSTTTTTTNRDHAWTGRMKPVPLVPLDSLSSPHMHSMHPQTIPQVSGPVGATGFDSGFETHMTNGNNNCQPVLPAVSMHLLKSYRLQTEAMARALLDRYDYPDHPLAPCNPTSAAPIGMQHCPTPRFPMSRAHASMALPPPPPMSPGLLSTMSPLGPTIPSSQSLTNTSLYANSWYVSLGRLGRQGVATIVTPTTPTTTTTMGPNQPEQTSMGSGAGSGSLPGHTRLPPCVPLHNNNNNNHSLRATPKSYQPTGPPGTGGGWQTPDSGAGSSSTNEVAHPAHPTMLYGHNNHTLASASSASSHGEEWHYASTVFFLLDSIPSLWESTPTHCRRPPRMGSSCDDSDSDSTDSDSDSAQPNSRPSMGGRGGTQPPTTVQQELPRSSWTRREERRLRVVHSQLYRARRLLRASIVDASGCAGTEEETESRRTGEEYQLQSIASPINLDKLPIGVLLENAILLQELYTVKEEHADSKARVYLLEKELHANRLTLESRAAAEQALRAHLTALMAEKQQYWPTTSDMSTEVEGVAPRIGQTETTLLRGQVKNLLQALEALRHSTELQQQQSEELVDDLKRANSALIGAFEKAKRKYLARIGKLEGRLNSPKPNGRLEQNVCTNTHLLETGGLITQSPSSAHDPTALHRMMSAQTVSCSMGRPNLSMNHPSVTRPAFMQRPPHPPLIARPLPALPRTESPTHQHGVRSVQSTMAQLHHQNHQQHYQQQQQQQRTPTSRIRPSNPPAQRT